MREGPTFGRKVAVKVIKAREAFRKQAKTEIKLLEMLNTKDPEDQWCIGAWGARGGGAPKRRRGATPTPPHTAYSPRAPPCPPNPPSLPPPLTLLARSALLRVV